MQKPKNYVKVTLRTETLRRLLAARALHLDELHCENVDSKKTINRVLLDTVIAG